MDEGLSLVLFRGAMGQIWGFGALAAWLATAMLDAQPRHLEERWEATHHMGTPLPCSIPSSPPTALALLALAHVHIRVLPQIRREQPESTPPS